MKDLFYFTKKERRGIAILLGLCLLFLLLPYLFAFKNIEEHTDFAALELAIAKLEAQRDSLNQTSLDTLFFFNPNTTDSVSFRRLGLSVNTTRHILNYRKKGGKFKSSNDFKKIYSLPDSTFQKLKNYIKIKNSKPSKTSPKAKLFQFDPNSCSKEKFVQLGISKRVATTIINYRNKGGKFFRKEDLKKIYGLADEEYQRLKAYIRLPDQRNSTTIDINKASAQEWQSLRGIGPSISGRIIKFRDKLGGFINIEQVAQTYGLPDSTFQKIKKQLVHSPILKKIAINQLTKEELQQHPYINWKQAQILINYRKHHGNFTDHKSILKSMAFKEKELEQLLPYLNFD